MPSGLAKDSSVPWVSAAMRKMSHSKVVPVCLSLSRQRMMWPSGFGASGLAAFGTVRRLLLVSVQ